MGRRGAYSYERDEEAESPELIKAHTAYKKARKDFEAARIEKVALLLRPLNSSLILSQLYLRLFQASRLYFLRLYCFKNAIFAYGKTRLLRFGRLRFLEAVARYLDYLRNQGTCMDVDGRFCVRQCNFDGIHAVKITWLL